MSDKSDFLFPKSRYYGQVKPENLAFNANLQEFATRVGYISALATNGKIGLGSAFSQIEALWEELETSKKCLRTGENPFMGG